MVNIFEYRVGWSVALGGEGVSVFHLRELGSSNMSAASDAIADFFELVAILSPNDVTFSSPSEIRVIDSANGNLVRVDPAPTPWSEIGGSAGTFAGPAGSRIDWLTGAVVNSRRLTGRTYLVPLASTQYDTDGRLLPAYVASAIDWGNDLITALSGANCPLVVWSRAHGAVADVTGPRVAARMSVLRSRSR